MAYDEALAERVRAVLRDRDDVEERKMFGGIAFMVAGRMAVGVMHDDLMVKVGRNAHAAALSRPHTRPMDFTGKPMRDMIYVRPEGTASESDLRAWIDPAIVVAVAASPWTRDGSPGS